MTCLEKYILNYGTIKIRGEEIPLEAGCPMDYKYADRPKECYDMQSNYSCRDCWNREVDENFKENKLLTKNKAVSIIFDMIKNNYIKEDAIDQLIDIAYSIHSDNWNTEG